MPDDKRASRTPSTHFVGGHARLPVRADGLCRISAGGDEVRVENARRAFLRTRDVSCSIRGRSPPFAASRSTVAKDSTQREPARLGRSRTVEPERRNAPSSQISFGRLCTSIFVWWTRAISRSRTARPTSTASGPPTRLHSVASSGNPVLFVSPPVEFPKLDDLRNHLTTETRPQSSEASRGSRATGTH